MSAITSIEWCDRTWNCIRGCSLVSDGCRSCYAMKQAHRFSGVGKPYHGLTEIGPRGPRWTGKVVCDESKLLEPLSWRKPARIFVNSMSDLFHEDVSDAFIDKVFAVMALTERHTFQILTKRADRMRAYVTSRTAGAGGGCTRDVYQAAYYVTEDNNAGARVYDRPWPFSNVWLGVSVENQKYADERIPLLIETPAAVRFISAEPLLSATNLHLTEGFCRACKQFTAGTITGHCFDMKSPCFAGEMAVGDGIDWVIVGGESGHGARPFDLAWARSIVQQCKAASVPVFLKQLGAKPFQVFNDVEQHDEQLKDRKGGSPEEWPDDLRIRQFPTLG